MKGKYHQKEISALLEFRECSSKAKKKKKKALHYPLVSHSIYTKIQMPSAFRRPQVGYPHPVPGSSSPLSPDATATLAFQRQFYLL